MTNIADSLKNHKSGKSSAESEGSPDEIFTVNNRKKPGQLSDNIGLQRYMGEDELKYYYFRTETKNLLQFAGECHIPGRNGESRRRETSEKKEPKSYEVVELTSNITSVTIVCNNVLGQGVTLV